jgi:putative ABC transport system permease protein
MLLIRMAWRNLRRNLKRSLITGSAIALGLAMLVVFSGFGDGAHDQMVNQGVSTLAGHVVVQGRGWQQRREVEIVVPNSDSVARRLTEVLPDAVVVRRVFLQGLLTSSSGSVGVGLSAVEPEMEAKVNDLHGKIVKGTWLDDNSNSIVLGSGLAKTLSVGLGDKVVLMTQRGVEIENRLFRVRGLFQVGIDEIDGFYALIPLLAAQEMLGLDHDVTQIAAFLPSARDTASATNRARAALADPRLDVLSWKQALPDLHEWVLVDEGGMYVMVLIMAFIVAMGILNTVLMSVMERTKEFGVMLAVGLAPGRLSRLVLIEATLLGALATLVGAGIGLLLNWPLTEYGFDYSSMMGGQTVEAAGVALESLVHSDLSGRKLAVFCALTIVMTVLSAFYPAWRASRLRPIQCLQHR